MLTVSCPASSSSHKYSSMVAFCKDNHKVLSSEVSPVVLSTDHRENKANSSKRSQGPLAALLDADDHYKQKSAELSSFTPACSCNMVHSSRPASAERNNRKISGLMSVTGMDPIHTNFLLLKAIVKVRLLRKGTPNS